jgi:hypothetical protein
MKKSIILSLCIIWLASCNNSSSNSDSQVYDLIITNASIVDVKNDRIQQEKLIVIQNDTIRIIDEHDHLDRYRAKDTIDAKGKFVMPALWDNHVHFRGGDTLIQENKNLLPLFLAHGVGTVRDAGGDITPSVLEWKNAILSKNLKGPKIFSSGPKLDGAEPAWPGSISVTSQTEAISALDSLDEISADYVKMYDGSLTAESYYTIIKEAETRGYQTTGHMPLSANILEAKSYGLDGAEHLYYILKSCSPLEDSLTALNIGYRMIEPLVDSYNDSLAELTLNTLASSDFYITPTLFIGKNLAGLADEDHSGDELLPYIGPGIQKTYEGRIRSAQRAKESGSQMRDKVISASKKLIKPMQEAGIHILAGSDCGPYNSFVYPGQSIHQELEHLVNAGLTPAEALASSVINGPRFFGLNGYYGSVEAGKVADILILDKNPLENIKATQQIHLLLQNGASYNKSDLQALLASVKY